ncbi:MAG TPA: XrtA system polysaccharide chain length determinant [Burkholderiales bacterium]|nr:XrtA system polysaccharide chain length determinant [Burkholderiales bacterium]
MSAILPQVSDILRGLWQGRWAGLAVAWLAGIAGAVFLFFAPDRYEASARVYVDTQSILTPLMAGLTVQPNVQQQVAMLSRTLISRPNMQKLVRMTDMDLRVRDNAERERIIDDLMKDLTIRSVGRDNLYTISYRNTSPQQAGRVVQSLLSIFVESGLTSQATDTGQARRFIEEQIKAYEQKLIEAENRIKEFKLKNLDLNAPAGGDFFTSMAAVSESARLARQQLQEAIRSREALKQQMNDEGSRPPSLLPDAEGLPSASTPELDARLAILNKNLDELLLRYTDNHPDVANTRRIIKDVEAQRDEERKRSAAELEKRRKSGGVASDGPLIAQLRMAFAQADAQVAALRSRVADLERREAALREQARSVPEREAQFTQLNRDYAIQKKAYDDLVARRESVTISGRLESTSGRADFRVIDPPRVSPTPVAPNRQMLVPLVLLACLGAGLGAAYLYSILRPTVHDGRTLKRIAGRPVLGAVSLLLNPQTLARRRRSWLWFFGGVGGLAASYSVAIAAVFLRGMLPF